MPTSVATRLDGRGPRDLGFDGPLNLKSKSVREVPSPRTGGVWIECQVSHLRTLGASGRGEDRRKEPPWGRGMQVACLLMVGPDCTLLHQESSSAELAPCSRKEAMRNLQRCQLRPSPIPFSFALRVWLNHPGHQSPAQETRKEERQRETSEPCLPI